MVRSPARLARRRLLTSAAMLIGAPLGARMAMAEPATRGAERVVERLVLHVWNLIRSRGMEGISYEELLPAIERQTDLALLARLALGRHWRRATPAQRIEFVDLFRRYVLQTFIRRLRSYGGASLGPPGDGFRIVASDPVGRRDVLVRTRLQPPAGEALQIDWRLRQRDGEPVIIDLIVEGVSLLVTQRAEFATVIERGGIDGLLTELRARIGQPI